ncbi:MAG: hypothetical protein ACXU9K_03720 [Thermodesulfobacteriota bacterium]
MKKQFCVAMMVVAAVSLTAGVTTAKSPMNLVGNWNGTVNFVGWNSSANPQFYYVDFLFPFEIQSQDPATGNFYGLESGFYPFTGNISTNKIVTIIEYGANGDYRIITGKVTGKKMTGTMQHFKSDQVDTGTFTFYKE